MRRVSFENLKPVKFTVGGEKYTMPSVEFARICMCAVRGSRSSIKEKIALSKLSDEQIDTLKLIGQISARYEDVEPRKYTYTPTVEQIAEEEKYQKFMASYEAQGKGAIGRQIYSGAAKTEKEAAILVEINKTETKIANLQKKEARKVSLVSYKPFEVDTDQGKQAVPVHEYFKICPCNTRATTEQEIKAYRERIK